MSRKTVFGFVFVAAATCLGVYMSRGPWLAYRDQKAKADAATKQMLKAEQEKRDLIQQKAQADDPLWLQKKAREVGYLGKDEVPLSAAEH